MAHQPRYAVSYTGPGLPVTVSTHSTGAPQPPGNQTHASSGWGEAPVGLIAQLLLGPQAARIVVGLKSQGTPVGGVRHRG